MLNLRTTVLKERNASFQTCKLFTRCTFCGMRWVASLNQDGLTPNVKVNLQINQKWSGLHIHIVYTVKSHSHSPTFMPEAPKSEHKSG